MSMGISKPISEIGDDNIKFQFLDNCMISADFDHKKGTVISFGSNQPLLPTGTKEFGIMIWCQRDKIEEIIRAIND